MTDDTPRDWRGTPITPGALVIYGAPVGRSIAMVEATVADPMLTKSGRIWLDIVRRSYGWAESPRVHVGADRLTVVAGLPPTDVPTDAEKLAERRARMAEGDRIETTHTVHRPELWDNPRCTACGTEGFHQLRSKECTE